MRDRKDLSIAIVGAGIGGLATAAALRRLGIDSTVYEQADTFTRVGAGIQQSPNAVKVHRGLGIEDRLRETGPAWFRAAALVDRFDNYLDSGVSFSYLQAVLRPVAEPEPAATAN